MSRYTAGPTLLTPTAAAQVQLDVTGISFATWGDWTEYIASTANPTTLLGISAHTNGGGGVSAEIAFGLGAAGNEVEIGKFAYHIISGGNGGPQTYTLQVPISGIEAGQRLCLRQRQDTGTGVFVVLHYAEDFDSDYCLDYDVSPMNCLPLASVGTSLTPSSTAWANSSWVELTSGLSDAIGIASFMLGGYLAAANDTEYEFDIGTGAARSETVIWTQPGVNLDGVTRREPPVDALSSLRYVPSNTRIAVRLRKQGTSTTAWTFKMNYYGPIHLQATGTMFPFWGDHTHIGGGMMPFMG
jgi:hypothetical protein